MHRCVLEIIIYNRVSYLEVGIYCTKTNLSLVVKLLYTNFKIYLKHIYNVIKCVTASSLFYMPPTADFIWTHTHTPHIIYLFFDVLGLFDLNFISCQVSMLLLSPQLMSRGVHYTKAELFRDEHIQSFQMVADRTLDQTLRLRGLRV